MPPEAQALGCLIFPLAEAGRVPEALRPKTLLELPRVMFAPGGEEIVRRRMQDAAAMRPAFAGLRQTTWPSSAWPRGWGCRCTAAWA